MGDEDKTSAGGIALSLLAGLVGVGLVVGLMMQKKTNDPLHPGPAKFRNEKYALPDQQRLNTDTLGQRKKGSGAIIHVAPASRPAEPADDADPAP